MTNEEAIKKMEFLRNAYKKLIDEGVDNGRFVGTGVEGQWKSSTPINKCNAELCEACEMAIEALEQQTRAKGKWIEHEDFNGDYYYTCSVCKEDFSTIDGTTPKENLFNFCPNCGADMRGDEE